MPMERNKIFWLVFAVLTVFVYLFALGLPLLGPDEPRYAQVAREMYERGDWVTTTLGGHHWFEKPALLYWLQITFYHLFGVTEFAARLGPALFGLGTVFSLWLLGRAAGPFGGEPDAAASGRWFGLVAATSLGLLVFARGASFDITITFPVTAALVSYFIWERRGAHGAERSNGGSGIRHHLPLILFYVFIGVGLIAKGLIGIVIPFGVVGLYHLLARRLPGRALLLSLLWGTALSILVASAWYLPMYLSNGWKFIDEFFIQHHFQRYTSNKYKHPQPFWFFWVIFPLFTIPWTPFFFAAVWKLLKESFSREGAQGRSVADRTAGDLRLYAAAWMLVPLLFFSLSGSKLPGYILPALPGACVLTALYVARLARRSEFWDRALKGLGVLMLSVVLLLLIFVVPEYAQQDSTRRMLRKASEAGYSAEPVVNLHTISHNLEFYASGRLVRDEEGRQRKFYSAREIAEFLEKDGRSGALVLVPHDFLDDLKRERSFRTEVLDRNAEHVLVGVRRGGE